MDKINNLEKKSYDNYNYDYLLENEENCAIDSQKLNEMQLELDNLLAEEEGDNLFENLNFNTSPSMDYNTNTYNINSKNLYFDRASTPICNNQATVSSHTPINTVFTNFSTQNDTNKRGTTNTPYYITDCKEKYNLLDARFNDIKKFKNELKNKNQKINELENAINSYKYEINRLLKKNEENIKLNQTWESTFKEIRSKIVTLEDEKSNLKEEIEKWKNKHDDVQFKLEIQIEKNKLFEENSINIKKLKEEQENNLTEMKKEHKLKEENSRKKFIDSEENFIKKLKSQDKEFFLEKEKLNEKIRELEKELSQNLNAINEVNDKLNELSTENKMRENELNSIIEEKDRKIEEIESNFNKLTEEANTHVSHLNDNMSEINKKICEKENFYISEIESIEARLNSEQDKNKNNEKIIKKLRKQIESHQIVLEKKVEAEVYQQENNKLQKEVSFLKKILTNKQEEVEKLQSGINKTLNSLNNSEVQQNSTNTKFYTKALNKKEEEIQNLILRNAELEKKNKKFFNELKDMNDVLEKTCHDYKCEINKKNEEIHLLKLNYDKLITEFNLKLDKVFY